MVQGGDRIGTNITDEFFYGLLVAPRRCLLSSLLRHPGVIATNSKHDGVVFYFHGEAGCHFALVSDASSTSTRASLASARPAAGATSRGSSPDVRFGRHVLTVAATTAAEWDPRADHLAFSFDREPVHVDEGHLSSWSSSDGGVQIERTGTVNGVVVTLPGVLQIMATAMPVTEEDNKVHRYGIPAGDFFVPLEVQFRFFGLSKRVEGVLGQTYQEDFVSPVKRGVPMPIMCGQDRYATSSLLAADCKSCVFSPDHKPAAEHAGPALDINTASNLDCTGNGASSGGHAVRLPLVSLWVAGSK